MNRDKKICVAIQLTDIESARANSKKAMEKGAQFIELRVDYYKKDVSTITIEDYKSLISQINVPVILTMRKPDEGGQIDITEPERFAIIDKMFQAQPALIDVEAQLGKENLDHFYSMSQKYGVGIIYSYHDFSKTPTVEDVIIVKNKFREKCNGLGTSSELPYILKMIFTSQNIDDNDVPFTLIKLCKSENINIISFCMGECGIPSRKSSINRGGYLTYASMESEKGGTAPGQVSIDSFY